MTASVEPSAVAPASPLGEFWGRETGLPALGVAGSIRAAIRLGALVLWTLPCVAAIGLGAPRGKVFRRWSRGVARLFGMRITICGEPPSGAFLLVTNHLSYMDVVLLASQMEARFVAKAEVASWPAIGGLARAVNTLFVDRHSRRGALRTIAEIQAAVRHGDGVVLFGEGTSSAGADVLPLKSTLLAWAAETAHPVHFATLSYVTPTGSPAAVEAVCWWGEMTLLPHLIRLAALPGFRATVSFGATPLIDSDRRLLAGRLRQAIRMALPKTTTTYPC